MGRPLSSGTKPPARTRTGEGPGPPKAVAGPLRWPTRAPLTRETRGRGGAVGPRTALSEGAPSHGRRVGGVGGHPGRGLGPSARRGGDIHGSGP